MEKEKLKSKVLGGKKAAETNRKRYGDDYYHKIGVLGGKASRVGGFKAHKRLAQLAGKLGGLKSRRNGTMTTEMKLDKITEIEQEIERLKEQIKIAKGAEND